MVRTLRPDGSQPIWLGTIGHVTNLQYGSTCPGGDDQLSCVLRVPPDVRTPGLDPGRTVEVYRGAAPVWTGQLNEPSYAIDGATLTAHGLGAMSSQFKAFYTGAYSLDGPVNAAISRGLPWANPGIAGGWLSQPPDSASISIADHLNSVCGKSAQVWMVDRWGVLNVTAIPSTVNRLLVATDPVSRTIADDVTTIWLKYTASDDGQGDTSYGLTDVFDQLDIDMHGATEDYEDLSNSGVMGAGGAQTVGNNLLARYQRAAFTGPFTVRHGQYMTTGGTPVDLGCERAGSVARLLVTDAAYGGEAVTGLISFVIGQYQYDDDAQVAQITPLGSPRADLSTLLSLAVPGA